MASVYTVSQISKYIKNMFIEDYLLENVTISGEVSNCKYHSSGHIYFTIKDKDAVLNGVMFAGARKGLKFKIEEGMQILVTGGIRNYEKSSNYQIYANKVTLDGDGELFVRFRQLKEELNEMGMFADCYKQPIPKFATKIGIATADTGAAIQDIINISSRRNPYVQLYLYPTLVQGEGAAQDIVKAIEYLDNLNLDVLIVGRGGGSIEDLWAFNEEIVARAIFNCKTPVISAVGHETDTTIADYVADMRAPTPSAAAELAVFDYKLFSDSLDNSRILLNRRMKYKIDNYNSALLKYESEVKRLSPKSRLDLKKQYLDELSYKLENDMNKKIRDRKHNLSILISRLEGMSPLTKLGKGYAYVEDETGTPLKSVSQLNSGDNISFRLKDGYGTAKVLEANKIAEEIKCQN
jgi:exodeoxyribonuclease VII large subunit